MAAPLPFLLKNLIISHHQSSMKIGTDGVLLGAYPKKIYPGSKCLDIGAGCGIITLMTIKTHPEAFYTCIDIDEASVKECAENICVNGFSMQCKTLQADLKNFFPENQLFDVIYSNPPFYINGLKPQNQKKLISKHVDNLNFNDLINAITRLLQIGGYFYIILPKDNSDQFIEMAKESNLFLYSKLSISSFKDSEVTRLILCFQLEQYSDNLIHEHLYIYNSRNRNDWSEGYKKMLMDFKTFN